MTVPVAVAQDRTLRVSPGQIVRTAWVPIHDIAFACRDRMAIGDVEIAYRRRLQLGDDQPWPPPVGKWKDGRFWIYDGRHEIVGALLLGVAKVLVAWIEDS